jgi:hypothetical protein
MRLSFSLTNHVVTAKKQIKLKQRIKIHHTLALNIYLFFFFYSLLEAFRLRFVTNQIRAMAKRCPISKPRL